MTAADLLVTGIGDLATLSVGPVPRTGRAMGEIGRIERAALAVSAGRFSFVGSEAAARRNVRVRRGGQRIDLAGASVLPGLVDAHTHVLFAGDRSDELARKVAGASYLEIARHGGGLLATVRATRRASRPTLLDGTGARLGRMLAHGATTIEVKSGYALDHAGELRLLSLVPELARRTGLTLVPTYLGAHAIPPRYARRPDDYVRTIVTRTLPEVARRRLAAYCDVFCEPGFFTPAQARRILRTALALGLGAKVHAEEFVWSGGARLAARLHATSADHLLVARPSDLVGLARSGVTAVLLPVSPFAAFTGMHAPGRALVDAGVPVALGSDLSPSAWVESMPLVLAHAVYSARLTPTEAITAATVNAAHAVGRSASAGQIAVGRPAEFVAFDLPSVEHVAYRIGTRPSLVSRQGLPVSPREVRE
ncbi:MAG: imidazolonepropionase [Thermoplasmata archaeon]